MRRIQVYGIISKDGVPKISNLDKFNKLFSENKGNRFIMDITVTEPRSVQHYVSYIMGMILPAYIEGMQEKGTALTPKEAYHEILRVCPMFYRDENKFYQIFDWSRYQHDCELLPWELVDAIEWLHEYILQNFGISIGNTKII